MKPYQIPENEHFVGREHEVKQIKEICSQSGSKILVVYGRRRIGKTELLEQSLRTKKIFKRFLFQIAVLMQAFKGVHTLMH